MQTDMRANIDEVLFFCGEHTYPSENGYVHTAFWSGATAAEEVLAVVFGAASAGFRGRGQDEDEGGQIIDESSGHRSEMKVWPVALSVALVTLLLLSLICVCARRRRLRKVPGVEMFESDDVHAEQVPLSPKADDSDKCNRATDGEKQELVDE